MALRALTALSAVAIAAVAGCGTQAAPATSPSSDAITVVASTNVWASVARAVGGDQVAVSAIVTSGDPHSYQVSARDAAALRGARLVVYNGGGYDDWVDQAIGEEGGPARVKAADLRPDKTDGNEHFWYDLPAVAQVAGELAAQLAQLRPAGKARFVAQADAFDIKLDDLEARVGRIAAAHPGAPVMATEPAAHHLLAAAGLRDVTPRDFVAAVEAETDPPAATVGEIQQLVAQRKVSVLVHNPQTETPVVTDLLGKAREAKVAVVDMTETLPDGQDYLAWMASQIQALSDALSQ